MDLEYYRQREAAERFSAESSACPEARHAHLELADRYRGVIEAYERLGGLQPSAI